MDNRSVQRGGERRLLDALICLTALADETHGTRWQTKEEGHSQMRAFYATHKHVRVFVLGVPEGWLVSVYDMQNRQWFDRGDCVIDTLGGAKSTAQAKVGELTGQKAPELKWH